MNEVVATFRRSMDDLVRQGLVEGRERGRREGVEQGSRAIVGRQVERRFGAAAAARVAELLAGASTNDIDAVADLVVDCEGPEDFLAGVQAMMPR